MNSEESSKMLSITPTPPPDPELASVCQWSCTFSMQHIMQPPLTDISKRHRQKPTENREAMCIFCCHFVGEESELERQHKGPVGTLSFVASLGQVPCSLCELNPTSDWSDLRNCIIAPCGTISTNSTAAGGF